MPKILPIACVHSLNNICISNGNLRINNNVEFYLDSWKENSDLYKYMTKIGGYDIDRLNKEPNRLVEEKNILQKNIHDLFFSNYKTFISTAENSQEIFTEFNQTEFRLQGLLDKIPKFISNCKSFCNRSKTINVHRRLNNLILSKSSEIVEILELPQLMKSCLQNNEYGEALELSQYAKYIFGKYGDISILVNIVNEIENGWFLMVNQVVDSLKNDLSLSKCLYFIGLLRSMDTFSESELRMKFIQVRNNWFQELLKSISIEDSNSHVTRIIEISRIHLFNIITQYKAIFNDNHLIFEKDAIINDSSIFHQWLEEKVSQFLIILEQDLFTTITIDSIIGQCTYFGLSFGRVGTDFTARISNIFIKVINSKTEYNISKATEKFGRNVESCALMYKFRKSDSKIEPIGNSENPPEQLIEYYPLAKYCNDLITIFNELRLSVPVAFVQSFTTLLQNSLHNVSKTMFGFYKKQQYFKPVDRQNMVKFTECFNEQLIPYIQYCIHALFPPNQLAIYFGTSVSQLQKEEISYLNQKFIIKPIESFLPIKNLSMDIYLPDIICSKSSVNLMSNLGRETLQQKHNTSTIDFSIEESNSSTSDLNKIFFD